MVRKLSGGCLCDAVRFACVPVADEMRICHCTMCRRWTSSVFMGVEVNDCDIADESALGVYASSEYGERVFCKTCGSSLFWRMRDGSHVVVAAQAFDDPGRFELKAEIFIDEKPDNYAFAGQAVKLTGAQALAAFAAEGELNNG